MATSIFSLPEEIILHILIRLPVKSLLKFKISCKRALFLIQSHMFVAAHLHHSHHKQFPLLLTCHETIYEQRSDGLEYGISLLLLLLPQQATPETASLVYQELPPSFRTIRFTMEDPIAISGSCNGLLCVSNSINGRFLLWNPATRQHRLLPSPLFRPTGVCEDYGDSVASGFGFVPEINDYKLVRVLQLHNEDDGFGFKVKAEVVSLSTGYWREIRQVPYCHLLFPMSRFNTVVVRGMWHMVVADFLPYGTFVLCFDLHDEVFRRIELPHYDPPKVEELLVYRDQLAVSITLDGKKFDIWGILENDSWSKLFTIDAFTSDELFLLGCWGSKKFIFKSRGPDGELCEQELFLYDVVDRTFMNIPKQRNRFFKQACGYTESLVSVFPD